MISAVVGLAAGTELAPAVHLGAADLLVLSDRMRYTQEPLAAAVGPGTWGYIPANSRVEGLVVDSDTELLMNAHGPVAFLGAVPANPDFGRKILRVSPATRHPGAPPGDDRRLGLR